jgi:hypothetical protein
MRRLLALAVLFTFVGAAVNTYAAEKPNPTGTWKLSIEVEGQTYEFTVKMKLDGAKVTGTMVGEDGNEIAIKDGKFKDGVVSMTVIREEGGEKIPVKSTAKITGDTMKGTASFELNGEAKKLPFEAKRVAAPKPSPAGTWKVSIEVQGQTYEYTMKLKVEGDKVSGTIAGDDGKEAKLQDVKFKDGVLTCTMVREEDGEKISAKTTATINGDTMKGKVAFELQGQAQNLPFEGKREKK